MLKTISKALTKEQLQFWNENSYIHIPSLFKERVNEMSQWIDEISNWESSMDQWMCYYEMDNPKQLSRVENFIPYHAGMKEIFTGSTIIDLITELMDEQAILYKERINFKSPGGGPHAAHQDGVAYEQGANASFDPNIKPYLSILVSVDEATEENGCLQVVPNWPLDTLEIIPMEAPYPDKPHYMKMKQSVEDSLTWKKLPTQPGDALIFTERLPHRSEPNHSDKTRRIIYGVYNPLSDGDKREKYYADKRKNPNDARYMVGNPHAPSN
ncbi:phytanoyl-CoA dioxygenase family protein [Reichenbachiella carrageenanivorans]|uniref:Phytanoyl-CoA dioxygenase family protein n=1 Tax=Reichenbachiella carrageenanivorans TaxID=2979869 RepID=A0ABY6CXS0_9BACT|nr:phytanoyl-CoA dioxygenase family protein [Reichenbachiella carrageenanivorans]UXX78712.1 phytanoyl-CoA dioxygenase family protein [Reichenbachiella carrageenanivorans]